MQTNKQKTILLVLDGLDYEYITQHLTDFALFRSLYEQKQLSRLESVVPADSIPAWMTIYTGQNPARHGLIESIDYLDYKKNRPGDYKSLQGQTVWDALGQAGQKVLVYNPFLAYPAWPVPGLMVSGPVFESGQISTNRPDLLDLASQPPLGGLVDQPTAKTMRGFLAKNLALTQAQFDAFTKLLDQADYDFAFLGILTADRIQHFLWRYTKASAKKDQELSGAILDTYLLLEKNIGRIIDKYGKTHTVLAISDHGHGPRCSKTFFINQWLSQAGYLKKASLKKRFLEYAKHALLLGLEKTNLLEAGVNFGKRFTLAHQIKNADHIFPPGDKIYAPNFDGTNPSGGIQVEQAAFACTAEYEKVRTKLIAGLLALKHQGRPVLEWAKRREELYPGCEAANYPAIVYQLDSDYGVDRGLFGQRLFGSNSMRQIISGGHQPGGVVMTNSGKHKQISSILDVYDFIISLHS